MNTLVIEEVDPQGPEAMSLLREAALEARSLYPELIAPGASMPTNPPRQERAAYFVAFLARTPVGCGALRPLNGVTAEVRRMYVQQAYRRSGVARALLAHLQQTASALHYTILRSETGNRQLSAMALYESFGFQRIAPFGEHADDPTSVCYEKRLTATQQDMAHFPKLLRDLPSFDGPFDAFKLEAKNCDVLFASYPKGTVIPPHSHDTENVGVITQGELILTIDGRETRYRAGEWYHVRAKATHAARFDVETSEIEFWFHVPPRA